MFRLQRPILDPVPLEPVELLPIDPAPPDPVELPELPPPIELDPPVPSSEPLPMSELLPIPDPLPPSVPRPDIESPGVGVPIAEPLAPLRVEFESDPVVPDAVFEPVPLPHRSGDTAPACSASAVVHTPRLRVDR
jgi:hypothetical protein